MEPRTESSRYPGTRAFSERFVSTTDGGDLVVRVPARVFRTLIAIAILAGATIAVALVGSLAPAAAQLVALFLAGAALLAGLVVVPSLVVMAVVRVLEWRANAG